MDNNNYDLSRSIFDNAPYAIIIYEVINDGSKSNDYIIKDANPKSLEIENWDRKNVIGKPLGEIRVGVEDFGIIDIFKKVLDTGETIDFPAKVYQENNIIKWFENTIFRLPSGEIVTIYSDVTELKEKEEKISFLSYRDSLTGLYNRAYLEEELIRLNTEDNLPITLIMGDLDGLKLINDVFGHHLGDAALKKVAEIFRASCRENDTISRWGGDEFIILLPKTTGQTGLKICEKIKRKGLEAKVDQANISISFGIASKKTLNENWEKVIKKAEDNMYKNKLLGANSYRSIVLASMKQTLYKISFESEEHILNLIRITKEIANKLNLSPYKLKELELLSSLHDIGNIVIDKHILHKKGKLTPMEWKLIKKHPETGYRIAQTSPELQSIADLILSHHERWDGKGYPKGLSNKDIPLLSRIFAVADAYDVMLQNRPYKKALSLEQARKELIKNSGSQFDPSIVDILIDLIDNEDI